jgi:ferrous iron transport protein B
MWLTFFTTFKLGGYPKHWMELGTAKLAELTAYIMPTGIVRDFLVEGIIGGVGGVIVFLPNIISLFLFISFMEDTGYMARAAFIMDKIMHKIGLHGGSFIPLIMGFGCNVPAIMSTRTIKNQNDRILTILINPFMSCSARLPVYVLILGAIFPRHAGNILLVIYCIGIALAVVIAIIFKKTLFKSEDAPFVMELPPYRVPTFEATMLNMWNKTVQYVQKMGGIILIASIIIWALSYFPKTFSFSKSFEQQIKNTEQEYSTLIQMTASSDSVKLQTLINARNEKLNVIISKKHEKERENSYIGQLGRFIQPVLEPLGFDWKMSVSLLAGIAGKEIVVSTMGVLYHSGNNENVDDDENLKQILKKQVYTEGKHAGKKVLTPIVAISYLLFILIYFPCIAVIAGVTKEAGGKWALFMIFYTTALAWFLSFFVYQIGSFFIL